MVKYRLKDLFNLFAGGDIDIEHFSQYKTPIYCFPIYSNSLNNKGLYGYTSVPKYKGNSITITGRGSVGHAEYRKQDFDAIIRLLVLIPKKSNVVNPYYLTQFINQYVSFPLESTGVPQLTVPQIENIEVALPDYTQQVAVAKALSDIDSLLSSIQKLIEKKKAIKQGTMQELLTGKKRLPGFSGEWSKQQLGDICNIVNGGTPSTSIAEFWNGKILWCTPTDITSCSTKYIYTTESKITESGLKASSATLLPKGALLLCSRATIGEVRIAGNTICTNQGFKSLVVHQNISNEWLYYMVHVLKFNMLEKAIGSTFLEISKKDLAELDIIVPEFTEQKALAQVLSDMDSEIELLEKKLAKYQQIKQGMMQELLTGRIRLV